MKNIGNFTATKDRLEKKGFGIWSNLYNNGNKVTRINRLRKGPDINSAVACFIDLTKKPNLNREVVLVVDFISKSDLADWLTRLKNEEKFGERRQIIQIIWLISSLINACVESGVSIQILCKE